MAEVTAVATIAAAVDTDRPHLVADTAVTMTRTAHQVEVEVEVVVVATIREEATIPVAADMVTTPLRAVVGDTTTSNVEDTTPAAEVATAITPPAVVGTAIPAPRRLEATAATTRATTAPEADTAARLRATATTSAAALVDMAAVLATTTAVAAPTITTEAAQVDTAPRVAMTTEVAAPVTTTAAVFPVDTAARPDMEIVADTAPVRATKTSTLHLVVMTAGIPEALVEAPETTGGTVPAAAAVTVRDTTIDREAPMEVTVVGVALGMTEGTEDAMTEDMAVAMTEDMVGETTVVVVVVAMTVAAVAIVVVVLAVAAGTAAVVVAEEVVAEAVPLPLALVTSAAPGTKALESPLLILGSRRNGVAACLLEMWMTTTS